MTAVDELKGQDCGNATKETEQAGAELCQAQVKLGIAKIEFFFFLNRKLRSSSISQKIYVVFNLIPN